MESKNEPESYEQNDERDLLMDELDHLVLNIEY